MASSVGSMKDSAQSNQGSDLSTTLLLAKQTASTVPMPQSQGMEVQELKTGVPLQPGKGRNGGEIVVRLSWYMFSGRTKRASQSHTRARFNTNKMQGEQTSRKSPQFLFPEGHPLCTQYPFRAQRISERGTACSSMFEHAPCKRQVALNALLNVCYCQRTIQSF